MNRYVLYFDEIKKSMSLLVGGKAANLGELSTISGINVPEGFCVTTDAYKEIIESDPELNGLLDELAHVAVDEGKRIRDLGAKIRAAIEQNPVSKIVEREIAAGVTRLGEQNSYAVRSSATAEDLLTASFAGQQDTYLNVTGKDAILHHIRKCWASLFTDRAIIYRIQNGFDHRKVYLAVIVQKMIFAQASGILFTADPVSGNRRLVSIEASFGLGEALVGGIVNPDNYIVRESAVVHKKVGKKNVAIYASKNGGTEERQVQLQQQSRQALMDEQILKLEEIGRKIEKHFGFPQDIEWCLNDEEFYIVQSRPITTLFPIPARPMEGNDEEKHVFVSVGHQQMMTDAMKPLGLSVWLLTAARPMFTAGGRLFVDVAGDLASPARRDMIINGLGKSDPLIKDALMTIMDRGDFIRSSNDDNKQTTDKQGPPPLNFDTLNDYDASVVDDLIKRKEDSIEELKLKIQTKSGTDLTDFIFEDFENSKRSIAQPESFSVIMTGMNASWWLNEKIEEWLGEKNAADTLSLSVPNNVTSEMGLALLDVADVIRPYPEVIRFLQNVKDDNFLNELPKLRGGNEARVVIENYLDKYGMRCAGEIDITRTRWSEKPTTLLPIILSNVRNFEEGAGKQKFEEGRQAAMKKEQDLLSRLMQLPGGEQKAAETKRMINLVRNLIGYREYPKYSMVSRYFVYKLALLKEAGQLLNDGVFDEKEDIYYLDFDELREVVRTRNLDRQIINQRKEEYKAFEKLTPPRVITSDGEIITGSYKRNNLPAGALIGLAVSSGIIEGRARVILNMEDANLAAEDILITSFTDPSWTPLFVSIKALVTEVGGLMTHGAVIAREYGLPAVIGVENATKLIRDGQRIRVNGTEGYVEILDDAIARRVPSA